MKTGFEGTFVISWSQTEVDGLSDAPVQNLKVGAAWEWYGDALRVDGPNDVLQLDQADGSEDMRRRAARMVQRLVGAALEGSAPPVPRKGFDDPATTALMDNSFVVTEGSKSYTVTLIDAGRGRPPLLMFLNELPPRNCELWVVHHTLGAQSRHDAMAPGGGGVICFTPGTLIATAQGARPIEMLREGDLVQTKDSGMQPIRWIGSRRMSGARLFAMPMFRPIRIRNGALGLDRPEGDLVVSPQHRLLLRGPTAQALFNTPEVLVAAKDLINGRDIAVDLKMREVTYIHLLLDQHHVLWANGVETESFHPASASLSSLNPADRERLLQAHAGLDYDPHAYGGFARRNLSASEAAILLHAA